jgi:hypothetical protein
MKGKRINHDFGTILMVPGSTALVLQSSYRLDCGCQLVSGHQLDGTMLAEMGGPAPSDARIDQLAKDHFRMAAIPCEQHEVEAQQWTEMLRWSFENAPEDREAMEVAIDYFDGILDSP